MVTRFLLKVDTIPRFWAQRISLKDDRRKHRGRPGETEAGSEGRSTREISVYQPGPCSLVEDVHEHTV